MSLLDIFALLILIISVLTAIAKGILIELLALGSTLAGLAAAFLFFPVSAGLFYRLNVPAMLAEFLGFVTIFVGFILAGSILAAAVNRTLKLLKIKWFDRLLGGLFGFLRGYLINMVVFMALAAFPISKSLVNESRLSSIFLGGASRMITIAPEGMKERFWKGLDFLSDEREASEREPE